MEMKIATWLASVYEAGPITIFGKNIGISIPTAVSMPVLASLKTFDLYVVFKSRNPSFKTSQEDDKITFIVR